MPRITNVDFKIDISSEGLRLDVFLAEKLPSFSRAYLQKQIVSGQIKLNDYVAKPRVLLKEGDTISGQISVLNTTPTAETGEIEIIFKNENFIAINKPFGLVVHPAHGNTDGTLVNYLLEQYPHIKKAVYDETKTISLQRPGIVHRLDKDTSGIMLVALNKSAMIKLSRIIHDHKLQKTYLALVYGWPEEEWTESNYLKRSRLDRRKMESSSSLGKQAKTNFKVLKYYQFGDNKIALVEAKPLTGRTHQIRVHLKDKRHPILGDNFYYSPESQRLSLRLNISRQLLHAANLIFRFMGEDYNLSAPLPNDFQETINQLKESNE